MKPMKVNKIGKTLIKPYKKWLKYITEYYIKNIKH